MKHFGCVFLLSALASSLPLVAYAQAAAGDGLRGDYYAGLNFERYIKSRRDALIDFSWQQEPPMRGVPAEQFTVRWTGWLVPPTTGHYVLHLAVDDGARLWLDGKQLLDEWRGQPQDYYTVPVDLQAGRPYRLRLDYCQYSRETRALLIWERPRQTEKLRASSWRNLWGMTEKAPPFASRFQETVPTRYLFSRVPPPPKLAVDLAPVVVVRTASPLPASASLPGASQPAPAPRQPVAKPKPVAARPPTRPAHRPKASATTRHADTLAAQLLRGRALTLRTLYFEQGQASLDTLAQVLRRYPALSLEVQGHTDNQGDPLINQQLSQRRAEAVCQYLAAQGIAASRLQPVGLGGTQPVADNNLLAQRPRNRRVVLRPLP